jgi:hypothetical protein
MSEATITHKKEHIRSLEDIEKTIKKPSNTENIRSKEETTIKSKKNNGAAFAFPINTRLSQLSLFGGAPSMENMVSAFSLLEESEPIVLEPQPSINDLSLSIKCIDEIDG